jgi:hypothetical protein
VLISLLAMLMMAFSAGIRAAVADSPVVLEGPSTLELALIGGGILGVYALATRSLARRRARMSSAFAARELTAASPQRATETDQAQEASRGAA